MEHRKIGAKEESGRKKRKRKMKNRIEVPPVDSSLQGRYL